MSAVTKQEIVEAFESAANGGGVDFYDYAQRLNKHGIAPDMHCGTEKYPLNAYIWKRESTNEWVLEISGSINDCFFTSRHTEPLDTKAEDVASLPTLYKKIESIAPPDGLVLVPKSIHPLDVDYGERAIELLANPPCAKRFNNSDDYYADWWAQLVAAAAPEVSE